MELELEKTEHAKAIQMLKDARTKERDELQAKIEELGKQRDTEA